MPFAFKYNLGIPDRIARFFIFLVLFKLSVFGPGSLNDPNSILLWIIAILIFVEAIIGYSPLYDFMGWSTRKAKQ
ncbi:MAG: DUF2892 domain-containing protein [Chitinophagales bacterium]